MAKTIGDLIETTTVEDVDLLEVEQDPNGAPASRKLTMVGLKNYLTQESTLQSLGLVNGSFENLPDLSGWTITKGTPTTDPNANEAAFGDLPPFIGGRYLKDGASNSESYEVQQVLTLLADDGDVIVKLAAAQGGQDGDYPYVTLQFLDDTDTAVGTEHKHVFENLIIDSWTLVYSAVTIPTGATKVQVRVGGQYNEGSIVNAASDDVRVYQRRDSAPAPNDYELTSNKATDFSTVNDTLYPSVKATQDAIVAATTGLLDYRGTYDASGDSYPTKGGSGASGAVAKGDFWVCSVSGALAGSDVTPGDLIIALTDTPGQTDANWNLVEHSLDQLGSAAFADTTDFATAAQGDKADSAVQEAPNDGSGYERKGESWAQAPWQRDSGDAVLASGKAGIGTSSPEQDLHILRYGNSAAFLIERGGGSWVRMSSGTQGSAIKFNDNTSFSFGPVSSKNDTSLVSTFAIQGNGKIGFGTLTPQADVHVTGTLMAGRYTVSTLPSTATEGSMAYATDGLKQSESTGNGTGVPVYYSNGGWLRTSDDTTVGA